MRRLGSFWKNLTKYGMTWPSLRWYFFLVKVSLLCMKASISQPMIPVFSLDGTYLYQQKVRYLDSFSIITQIHITSQTCFSRFNYSWSRQAKNLDSSCCAKLLRRKSDYPDSDFWQLLNHPLRSRSEIFGFKKEAGIVLGTSGRISEGCSYDMTFPFFSSDSTKTLLKRSPL